MNRPQIWLLVALVALAGAVAPGSAEADFVCPLCKAAPVHALGSGQVVKLVLTTLLQKGVAVLLLGATVVVSLPWLVAGVLATAFYLPQKLRVWW